MNPEKLDNGGGDTQFAALAYDTLIRYTPEGTYVPDLATTWKASNGNKTFTVKIRPGVRFSDGATMTTQDVVDTIKAEKGSGTTCATYISNLTSVSATDARTVVMHFSSPTADLPAIFDQNGMCGEIVGKKVSGTHTDGTGPYKLDASQTVTGSTYVYVQNPYYWNTSLRRFKTVTLKVFTDTTSAFNALRDGQVDYITGDATQVSAAKSAGMEVYSAPGSWQALWLTDFRGTLVPALAKKKVRQAIAYGIDRAAIAKAIYGDYAKANDETQIPGYQGYAPKYVDYFHYNPSKAKQLLSEAGYPHGFTFTTIASRDLGFDPVVQAVVSQLSKIGITVKIKEDPTHNEAVVDLFNRKYPSFVWGFGALQMPVEATELFGPKALFNPFHNPEPYMVKTINKANALSGAAANKLYQQAEIFSLKQAWDIGLFEVDSINFARPGKVDQIKIGPRYPAGDLGIDIAFWSPPAS